MIQKAVHPKESKTTAEDVKILEEEAESPIIAEVLACPVCKHPIGKHNFFPMEILLEGEIITGSSIHCTDITCERASKEGEACFVENFLELLEPIVEDGSEEE